MVLVTVDNPYPKCTTFTAVTNPLDETHPDVMQYNLMKAENTIGDLKDAMTEDCGGGGRAYITISFGDSNLDDDVEVVQGQHYQSSYSGRTAGGKKRRKTRRKTRKKTRRKMRRKSSGGKKRRKKSKTRKRKSRKQRR